MLPMVILPFLIFDSSNNIIGERVFLVALFMGVLGFAAFQFMIRNTEVRVEEAVRINEEKKKFNVVKAMGNFLHNRPAVGATVAAMGMFIGMQGAVTAVQVLFQSYFQNVQLLGVVQMFSLLPIILFTPLARKMVMRFGKKEISVVGSLFSIFAGLALLILPITPDGTGLMIYIVCMLIFSLGLGIYSTVSWALMGDAIDYNEWKNGVREEGVTYSLHSFFRKLAQGIGPALTLVIMVGLGYVEANKGNQTFDVALRMRYLVAWMYFASAAMQFIGLGLIYNLDKKRLAKMNEELEERRTQSA
jgi:GPH family glycoside/pentoside/hexuronide:cation symporter